MKYFTALKVFRDKKKKKKKDSDQTHAYKNTQINTHINKTMHKNVKHSINSDRTNLVFSAAYTQKHTVREKNNQENVHIRFSGFDCAFF